MVSYSGKIRIREGELEGRGIYGILAVLFIICLIFGYAMNPWFYVGAGAILFVLILIALKKAGFI